MLLQRDVSKKKPMFAVITDISCASYQLALVQAITSTAMIQEFDILSAVLYRIFQREGGVYVLLFGLLEHEVRLTGTYQVSQGGYTEHRLIILFNPQRLNLSSSEQTPSLPGSSPST